MNLPTEAPGWMHINWVVEAYEAARLHRSEVDLAEFLPPPQHPNYLAILTELVRVDMEYAWRSRPVPLSDYLQRFPELRQNQQVLRELAAEESRQRQLTSSGRRVEAVPAFRADFPAVGSTVLDFELLRELGRGSFSRVYLARQIDLGGRLVALKVARGLPGEPQLLARLQHTHIMPIYSAQRWGPFEVLCMPYLGSTTMQHLLRTVPGARNRNSAELLLTTLRQQAALVRDQTTAGVVEPVTTQPSPTGGKRAERKEGEVPVGEPQLSESVHRQLKGRAPEDLVVWLGLGMARGLEHAHERGILHLDLKPANVLLTDEGQPLLLDFNLGRSSAEPHPHIGGTLPYMAPEQQRAYAGEVVELDGRTDVYAVGVILYQLLTGELPESKGRKGGGGEGNPSATPPTAPPRWPLGVSPALCAIIRRCLEPDPARRYPSAHHLAEDLERHFQHLPLRHQPEPSVRERLHKWLRRHPQTLSFSALAAAVLVVMGLLGLAVWSYQDLVFRFEAAAKLWHFRQDLEQVRYLLLTPRPDQERLRRGLHLCRSNLDRYGAGETEPLELSWLPATEQSRLRQELGEQLYLLARADREMWDRQPAATRGPPPWEKWLVWLRRSAESYGQDRVPRVVLQLGAKICEEAGQFGMARSLTRRLQQQQADHVEDLYLTASDHMMQGEFRAAQPLLHRLLNQEPQHLWGWVALGYCHNGLGQPQQAVGCFSTALALRPQAAWCRHLRGLAYLEVGKADKAVIDLEAAVQLAPDWREPILARALAWQQLQRWDQAVADYNQVLKKEGLSARVLLLRARARRQAGDAAGAEADLVAGLQLTPTEEMGWVARGLARVENQPELAQEDFDQALQCNPHYQPALQNKAHVLAERLQRPREALAVLDRLIRLYPEYLPGRAGRAVLLARLQDRAAAHREVQECLLRHDAQPEAETVFQLACVFALTSRQHPADAERALDLLAAAFRQKPGLIHLATDPDLDPLRRHPGFVALLAAANLASNGNASAPSPRKH